MKYLLVILLFPLAFAASAQKKSGKREQPKKFAPATKKDSLHVVVHAMAENYGDSIVVRWAPGNSVSWLLSQKSGFRLRRLVFKKGQKNVFSLVDSSSVIIHPWKLDAWGAYFKSSHDSLSAIAAQVMYGKTMNLDKGKQGNSFNNISDKYNEQQNRFGFALLLADFDPAIANGLGFRFVDRQIRKDWYYLYAVLPEGMEKNIRVDTGRVLINGSQRYQRETFPAITAVPGDKIIKLFWNTGTFIDKYSAYIIERSEDNKNFTRLNQLPFVSFKTGKDLNKPAEFSDSVARNYKKYYYRVSGINAFGDRSYPSPVLVTYAMDLTAPHNPIITSIKNIPGTGKIELQWMKKDKEADFKGYVVGRSTNLKGPFDPVSKDFLPFGTNSFTDDHPSTRAPNYYIVAAVDTAGNAGRSMPAYMNVEDHTAPAQPVGLAGHIDSNGRVIIHWNWGKEDDLAGYKIFFANSPDHKFTPLYKDLLTDTVLTDSITLRTLTRKIYYKVIAYDRSMNPSPPSSILALTKPDKVAPVAATIKGFNVSDTGVVIRWWRSSSEDAAQQVLYRKEDSSADWIRLPKLAVRDTLFTDRQVKPRHTYTYAIETIDSSGLHSDKSFPLRVYVYDKGYRGDIRNFSVSKAQDKNSVSLRWKAPAAEVNYYILFKGSGNDGLRMVGNIPGTSEGYEDKTVPGNYRYALRAVYKDGSESAVSEIKTISFQ